MFVDDSSFDDDDYDRKPTSNTGADAKNVPPPKPARSSITLDDWGEEDELEGMDNSSSRARMLAQQRDLQLKKRQTAAQSAGMVRSSIDAKPNSPVRKADEQFTPAVRQFSAPKTLRDVDDDNDFDTEFNHKPAIKVAAASQSLRVSRDAKDSDDEYDGRGRRTNESSRYDNDSDDDNDRFRRNSKKEKGKDRGYKASDREDRWDTAASAASSRGEPKRPSRSDREENDRKSTSLQTAAAQNTPRNPVQASPLDLSDMRRFLTSPVPKGAGIIQCYIRRNKSGTNKLFPVYSLFLKDERFLLTSKKRPNNKTSNYLISMSEGDLSRDGTNFLGKLRSNFVGTDFQAYDNGINPKDNPSAPQSQVRKELGSVMYAANVLGSRGPRKMQAAIPAVDENNEMILSGPGGKEILQKIKDRDYRDLVYLINKPPRWNEQVGAYVLNFNGRVTMASVKNFQLVDPEEQNTVVLQFGRVGKDEFTMDLQWPMSPFQAFAITLSSFDSKIACD